jgi:D-alanyl-D-alanine carboxypeptidase (penicillin-binding protein 5/6)
VSPGRRRYRYRLRRLTPVWLAVAAAVVVGAWTGSHRTPTAVQAAGRRPLAPVALPAVKPRVTKTQVAKAPVAKAPVAKAPVTTAPVAAAKPLTLLHGPPLLAGRIEAQRLAAAAAILVDARTGHVLWAKHAHERRPIASTTKIMTALLALRQVGWHERITVDGSVTRVPLVREGLRAGEQVQAWKLFYSMLLYSGNDDALQLALAAAGSRPAFLHEMNAEARRLGMRDTHYSSTSGVIDRGNYSSAWDLAALTRVALRNPVFRKIVRTKRIRVPWTAPTFSKIYVNNNWMLREYPGAIGVKTGYTHRAGWCLVTAATRRGHTLIAVVLHSGDVYSDSTKLLNLGFRSLD